jgi:hypothetical protein
MGCREGIAAETIVGVDRMKMRGSRRLNRRSRRMTW